MVEPRIEPHLIARGALHEQHPIEFLGEQGIDPVLAPQPFTVDGLVVVAVVRVDGAMARRSSSLSSAVLPTPDIPVINTRPTERG